MRLHSVLTRSLFITITAVTLAAGLTAPALAAAAARPVLPNDTQEWGNDKIRVAAMMPTTLSVSPSGGRMQSSSGLGAPAAAGLPAASTQPSVDYCVELDLTDGSSGPYRLQFHVPGAGGVPPPLPGNVTLTFNLATAADAWVTTTGNAGLSGVIYDANAQLVAGDGAGSRIAASLPAGYYSLLLQGASLTGAFTATADQGTCGN